MNNQEIYFSIELNSNLEIHPIEISYFWGLWNRILDFIRQSISSYSWISNSDTLLILPGASYVFPKKISLIWNELGVDENEPAIVIQENEGLHAYIFNGLALRELHQNNLLEICLEKTENSVLERDLWRCIKNSLKRKFDYVKCVDDRCFVYFEYPSLTISHIKNGTCLKDRFRECQSVAILYPITFEELITLEFFKYRIRSKPLSKSI